MTRLESACTDSRSLGAIWAQKEGHSSLRIVTWIFVKSASLFGVFGRTLKMPRRTVSLFSDTLESVDIRDSVVFHGDKGRIMACCVILLKPYSE